MLNRILSSLVFVSSITLGHSAYARYIPFFNQEMGTYFSNLSRTNLPFTAHFPADYVCIPLGRVDLEGIVIGNKEEIENARDYADVKSPVFKVFYYDTKAVPSYIKSEVPDYLEELSQETLNIPGARLATLYRFRDRDDHSLLSLLEVKLSNNETLCFLYFVPYERTPYGFAQAEWNDFITSLKIKDQISFISIDFEVDEAV